MCVQLCEQCTLEVRTLCIVPIDDSNGRNPLLPCPFKRIGIRFVRDDNGDFGTYLTALNRLDDGREIGAAPRAKNANFLLTHQRHRP